MRNSKVQDAELSSLKLHAIDSEAIQAGDIVLTYHPRNLKSKAIAEWTKSDFSHALICTEPPECVEAVGKGVVRLTISHFLIIDKHNVKVLRLKPKDGKDRSEVAKIAATFAANQVTLPYAYRQVISSFVLTMGKTSDGKTRFFCSQLVAAAYKHAGLMIAGDTPPEGVAPGMLADSRELMDVSSKCIIEAEFRHHAAHVGYLDGDAPETPLHIEVSLKRKLLQRIQPQLEDFHLQSETYDELLVLIAQGWASRAQWASKLDSSFAAAMRDSGLLDLPQRCFPPDWRYYFEDLYLSTALAAGILGSEQLKELEKLYRSSIRDKKRSMELAIKDMNGFRIAYVKTGLESALLQVALMSAKVNVLERELGAFRRALDLCEKGQE